MTVRVEEGPGASRWVYAKCEHCGQTRKTRAPMRIQCKGNCGRWWYSGNGRKREWCERCYPMHRAAHRAGREWPSASLVEGEGA